MSRKETKIMQILDHYRTKTLSNRERRFLRYKPIKKELVGELWTLGSGAKGLMHDNPGYYRRLVDELPKYPNPWFYQIELDLHRTFSTDELIFSKDSEPALRRVLAAYVQRNPSLGYCQGLNFIVAILLNQLEEEQAFWVFCQMLEGMLPIDYYTTMAGIIIDQKCFEQILISRYPELAEHLEENNYKCESFMTQWFVCAFATTLNFEVLVQVWNMMFIEGITAIFKTALAIFDILHDEILIANDIGELFIVFKLGVKKITSFDQLLKSIRRQKLRMSEIRKLRQEVSGGVYSSQDDHKYNSKKQQGSLAETNIQGKLLSKFYLFGGISKLRSSGILPKEILANYDQEVVASTKCNLEWPIWLYDIFFKTKEDFHFCFKSWSPTNSKIDIVDDHFNHENFWSDQYDSELENPFDDWGENNQDLSMKSSITHPKTTIRMQNAHVCNIDHFEQKFKLLYCNNDSRADSKYPKPPTPPIIRIAHRINQEYFNIMMDEWLTRHEQKHTTTTPQEFIEAWNDLVEKIHLNVIKPNGETYFDQLLTSEVRHAKT